ncbi:serine hydrolase [Rhodoferax bucti]|uniref:serine hydrolase n=1 Tax=Rhodoferax bucti TaxID=2576305 RepID=UPI001477045C|nr:serine hydrolase [Rhodoferax bucti]
MKRTLIQLGLAGFLVSALLIPQGAAAASKQKKSASKPTVVKVHAKAKEKALPQKKLVAIKKTKGSKPVAVVQPKPSFGQLAGLHGTSDALALKSSVAFVVDQDTKEVLFSKNENAVLPIASITKLMTGVVISEAHLPMDETIEITQADVDTEKGSRSRLIVGTELSRGELLHLALMASENRAAHALGRTFPGGLQRFVGLMNSKARGLGMADTQYVEPTGLSSRNQSSARDLATLVNYAYGDPTLRELSTSTGYQVEVGNRTLQYNNTNRLVKSPAWDIGLQKTGYITEAGQCLVMQAKVAGRKLIMVFLDSTGKLTRIADAERVRKWVETSHPAGAKASPLALRGFDSRIATN